MNRLSYQFQMLMAPKGRAFQASLLAAFTLLFVIEQLLSFFVAGAPPEREFTFYRESNTARIVTSVSPDAARDGLHVNDKYNWASATDEQCRRRFLSQRVGQVFELPVLRGNGVHAVALRVRPMSSVDKWTLVLSTTFKVIGMLVGILLVARGAGRFGYYSGLAFFGTAAVVGESNNAILSFNSQAILYGVAGAIGAIFFYLHVEAVLELCKAPSIVRWFLRIPSMLATSYVLYTRWEYVQHAFIDSCHNPTNAKLYVSSLILLWLWPLVGYFTVMLSATERDQRTDLSLAAWMFFTYLIGGTGPVINLYFTLTGPRPFDRYLNATYAIMSVGFIHVSLRHSLINVRWVINRAAVYGLTAAVEAILFAFLEKLLARFGAGIGQKSENGWLEVAIAAFLTVMLKPIYNRIDRAFERGIFRRRDELERAFLRLNKESREFTDRRQLVQHVCNEIQRIIDFSRVAYYDAKDGCLVQSAAAYRVGTPSVKDFVARDDAALVALRAAKLPVDLQGLKSALGTDGTLFPIFISRKLVAALLCGHCADPRDFGPEERKMIAQAAHSTALYARHLVP